MKAVLDRDIIIRLGVGNVDIGRIPKKIGLDRLRWNGKKLVDLADLNSLWIVVVGTDFFELHAIEVPGSVKVAMNYVDRKKLTVDDGVIRIKTDEEALTEKSAQTSLLKKNLKRKMLLKEVGDVEDRLEALYMLVCYLIILVKTKDASIDALFDDLLMDISFFPEGKELKRIVRSFVSKSQLLVGDLK